MSLFKKPTVIAALFSAVIVGLSACGGDEPASDVDKAEEIRGAVMDASSKAKETASEATTKAKEAASEVTAKAKKTASDTVQRIEDKIKVPSRDGDSDSE